MRWDPMCRLMKTNLRGDGNIATVKDGRPAVERVGLQGDVVATATSGQNQSGAIRVIVRLTRDSVAWIPDEYRTVQNGLLDGKKCRCRMEHLGSVCLVRSSGVSYQGAYQ